MPISVLMEDAEAAFWLWRATNKDSVVEKMGKDFSNHDYKKIG